MSVQAEQDFFLITLRQMPITEEGIHRVAFRIDGDLLTTVEMPVLVQASDGPAH